MSFIEDDSFDDIVNQFFGGRNSARRNPRKNYSSEVEERSIDFIQTDDNIYLIFELAGFEKDDIDVNIKGKSIEVVAKKIDFEGIKEYLVEKFSRGVSFTREIIDEVNTKDFSYSMNNGVLELKFKRKK